MDLRDALSDAVDSRFLCRSFGGFLALDLCIPSVPEILQARFLRFGQGNKALLFGNHRFGERRRILACSLGGLLNGDPSILQRHHRAMALLATVLVLDFRDRRRLGDQIAKFLFVLRRAQRNSGALGQRQLLFFAHVLLLPLITCDRCND
ncbi:hypothetical protein WM24_23615 [Burkholderia ubonensis]|nr:hypothetical protein WM24_23615 [Burkholderia ubonensis]